jgi:hypothetical protein
MIISCCRGLLVLLIVASSLRLAAAEDSFPFDTALMLDAAPMRGSKRIPMLEIAENGAAAIDLWCATARAQAVVADNSISIAPGDVTNTQCEPERNRATRNFWRRWRRSQIGGARAMSSNFSGSHCYAFD